MAKASARHLLVSDEQTCLDLKKQIQDGADFGELAKKTLQLSFRSAGWRSR